MKLIGVVLLVMVSRFVTYPEAYDSPTAKKLGIKNTPTEEQELLVRYIAVNYFDPLRNAVGGPLYISSFYRSDKLNKAVGGSIYSDHLAKSGKAAIDIDQDGKAKATMSNAELFFFIRSRKNFHKLIWEFGTKQSPAWVHVAYAVDPAQNFNKVYRATRVNNKTVYEEIK